MQTTETPAELLVEELDDLTVAVGGVVRQVLDFFYNLVIIFGS